MRPYALIKPNASALSPDVAAEAAADSESFRSYLAEMLATATLERPAVVAASPEVPIGSYDAFWRAVARGLVGTGYEIKPIAARDMGLTRRIGPIGGAS